VGNTQNVTTYVQDKSRGEKGRIMVKKFLIKYVKIWWAGVKVFCRWCAFWIVLFILWLPAMALTDLVGTYAGYIFGMVVLLLIVPIIFFLTSKYLLLLGDEEQPVRDGNEDSTSVDGKRNGETGRSILLRKPLLLFIILLSFSIASVIITPPDPITQVSAIAVMVIIFGILIFIISRFKSFAQTPETIKILIVALACLLSITITYSVALSQFNHRLRAERSKQVTSTNPPEAAKF
jgi:hypothetical protein